MLLARFLIPFRNFVYFDLCVCRFVTQISISEEDIPSSPDGSPVMLWQCSMHVRLYRLFDEEPATEEAEDETVMCSITMLPSVSLDHMWSSLYYDISIKKRLLDYSCSAMFFAKKEVSPSLIAWNRVVLLHGPPGTGKTSLCRYVSDMYIRYSQTNSVPSLGVWLKNLPLD